MGEHLLNSHEARWPREVSPDGTPWQPLSEPYATRKRRLRPNAGMLVFEHILRPSLRYQISGQTLLFGTDAEHAATHQFGREFGRGAPIPARPFLGTSPQDEDALLDILRDYLDAASRQR